MPTYQMVVPNWDTTPRYGKRAIVFHNSNPKAFRRHLRQALDYTRAQPADQRIIFAKSWNEWAEGNYLEPDKKFGYQYLDIIKEVIEESK